MTWQPGENVVLRYFKRGRPVGAIPTRLVAMSDGPVLWLAPDTIVVWPAIGSHRVRDLPAEERFTAPWEAVAGVWEGSGMLILGRPRQAHSLWLIWDDANFAGWYVNLEAAWQPWEHGFDSEDHELDVWVDADGSWRWKDEDDLEAAVRHGVFSQEQASSFRAEGERVIAELPFSTGWESWQPDPSWPVPSVPDDWATST
jgi:Protein of unknown function (DUF402)